MIPFSTNCFLKGCHNVFTNLPPQMTETHFQTNGMHVNVHPVTSYSLTLQHVGICLWINFDQSCKPRNEGDWMEGLWLMMRSFKDIPTYLWVGCKVIDWHRLILQKLPCGTHSVDPKTLHFAPTMCIRMLGHTHASFFTDWEARESLIWMLQMMWKGWVGGATGNNSESGSHTASLILKPLVQWTTMPDLTDVCNTGKEKANPSSRTWPEWASNPSPSLATKLANFFAIKSKSSCAQRGHRHHHHQHVKLNLTLSIAELLKCSLLHTHASLSQSSSRNLVTWRFVPSAKNFSPISLSLLCDHAMSVSTSFQMCPSVWLSAPC